MTVEIENELGLLKLPSQRLIFGDLETHLKMIFLHVEKVSHKIL
jgi:hypothetical protein